jgi:uncharacterized membrane protein
VLWVEGKIEQQKQKPWFQHRWGGFVGVMDLLLILDPKKQIRQLRHHCVITLLAHDNIDILIIISIVIPKIQIQYSSSKNYEINHMKLLYKINKQYLLTKSIYGLPINNWRII